MDCPYCGYKYTNKEIEKYLVEINYKNGIFKSYCIKCDQVLKAEKSVVIVYGIRKPIQDEHE